MLLGGLDGLETGRALEAVLREDRRQVVGLQGVDEVVDAVRAGRIRRGLRREIVTTTLPSKGSWPSASSSGLVVQVPARGSDSLAR